MMLLAISASGLGIIGLLSLIGLVSFAAQARNRTPPDNFYEDQDGKSTPESMVAFSNRKPKICVLALAATETALSIAVSVLSTCEPLHHGLFIENWISTVAWTLILLQAILISAHHSPVQSYNLGFWAMLSCLIASGVAVTLSLHASNYASPTEDVEPVLRLAQIMISIPLFFSCGSLPRRPEVFYNGEKVASEMTASIISRHTWSWVGPLLRLAKQNGDLQETEIPRPDHKIRAEGLVKAWNNANHEGTLLRSLLRAYGPRLAMQWSLIVIRCGLGLAPFWALLQLIKLLEDRDKGLDSSNEAWGFVLLMGIFTLTEQWINSWINWMANAWFLVPIRGQLSALIFEKSLRRKNVKNAENSEAATIDGQPKDSISTKDEECKDEGEDENSVLKSSQAIVNLVGVDTNQIASFFMFQTFIVDSIAELLIYSTYLIHIIGWIPFGAGFLAWATLFPLNLVGTKYYLRAENRLMRNRDAKLAVVNEALLGIRQIKFSAAEDQWEKKILKMRELEISALKKAFIGDSLLTFCWTFSPILLAAAALATYSIQQGSLSPSIAFVSIGIFKSLQASLSALPELLTDGIDSLVSIRRIDKYLGGPEMKKYLTKGHDVAFENAAISWPSDEDTAKDGQFVLRNINLSFPSGELSVISGKTGSGKSLLLNSLIGEAELLEGSIYFPKSADPLERNDSKAHPGDWILPASVAFVGQVPWLESASLRDNILFGLPFLEDRYQTVLHICALQKDIEILPDGDKTELGANGVNLSGGQRWRLTLARAIYSRAEILIMDDIFSAVDAHVGRQIYENCLAGPICKGRTRILVTHHVALVEPITKYLVELDEGTVLHAGLTSDLEEDGTLARIKSHEHSEAQAEIAEQVSGNRKLVRQHSQLSSSENTTIIDEEETTSLQKGHSKTARKFVQDETRERGVVKRHVYATYMKACGGLPVWAVYAAVFLAYEAGNLGRNWWVRIWTDVGNQSPPFVNASHHQTDMAYSMTYQHSTLHASAIRPTHVTKGNDYDLYYYLWIYVSISVTSGLVGTFRFVWSFVMSIRASRSIFQSILFTVLRTRLRWLDTVPVGRVLNRLTADFKAIDNKICLAIGFVLWHGLTLGGICIAAFLVSGYMLPLAAMLFIGGGYIGYYYMLAGRPVKRLESNAKSPVFEIFSTSLAGVSTLRAFEKNGVYTGRIYRLLDTWDAMTFHISGLNRWLGVRMSFLGSAFVSMVGAVVVSSPSINAAMAGFTLSFALDFSENMVMLIRDYSALELEMNAAERVVEFIELDTEDLGGEVPPAAWPTTGNIDVEDLVVGYDDDLPPVLDGVSFRVKDNERIGVVGRTGAGKSSLTLALFRFLAARSGTIVIDGIDISKIRLHDLRSRLAIIPQDPVLFSGTIRSNLDPFDDHTDEELRDCLSRVHLTGTSQLNTPSNEPSSAAGSISDTKNTNIFKGLSSGISESGGNLSQGQRQLLCIARAIVSRPKIMVLDEATSAVDMTTDALIQRSIREEFTASTLIVIAHRLSTIADFDRILVLDEGNIAEFGTPRELWDNEGGVFRSLCEHSGERAELERVILGNSPWCLQK